MAVFPYITTREIPTRKTSGEFFSELFGQGVRGRVGYLIDMRLHFFPGLGLGVVISIPQLLDLLDVMAAMGQKKALHCVFRQIGIRLT